MYVTDLFSLAAFNILRLSLIFDNLIILCLSVYVFGFVLFVIFQAFWIWLFVFFSKFQKFSAIISLIKLSVFLSLFSSLFFWDSHNVCWMMSHTSPSIVWCIISCLNFLYSFSFFFLSKWLVFKFTASFFRLESAVKVLYCIFPFIHCISQLQNFCLVPFYDQSLCWTYCCVHELLFWFHWIMFSFSSPSLLKNYFEFFDKCVLFFL